MLFLIVTLGIFIALNVIMLESMAWQLGLAALVALAWWLGGSWIAMTVASILSIGIVIKSKIPTISKY